MFTLREGELELFPAMPSTASSAPLTELKGLAGEGRPFSLFFPVDTAGIQGLLGAAASLLGAGVNCEMMLVSVLNAGVLDEGVTAAFLPKKPRMLL